VFTTKNDVIMTEAPGVGPGDFEEVRLVQKKEAA